MWPEEGTGSNAAIPSGNEVPFLFEIEIYGLARCGKRKRGLDMHRFCKNDARKNDVGVALFFQFRKTQRQCASRHIFIILYVT
jgi:hypothetical protein